MRAFACVLFALNLVFLGAGSVQSQWTGAATSQTFAGAQTVAYCDLLDHSEKFENQMVRVQATYEVDFEKAVITSESCPIPFPVWVEFESHWESRTPRKLRKTVSQVKWHVPLDVVFIGKFEAGGRYGHMDMYGSRIEVYKVEAANPSKNAEPPKSDNGVLGRYMYG